ncbi:LCP family protein [Mitsuokella sp.]|uniref:LCP family protein n=1 Tax=Mitsuokella sp. TaxID=2049034 RepID=UPI002A83828A|nr:LCP family protein [Mitsuokella sp.]MDY4475749.1 LCP family protein [Mitsuokella sp.]
MRKTRKKKRSFRRVKWLALILVIIIAAVFGCYAAIKGNHSSHEIGDTDHQITHVMIMGVDSRKDDVGRSDTLMVASIDQTAEKAALLSIPRDTRVAIEGHGYDKINHAYAYGGHNLTKKSVEHLLGVPMDHYVIIDTKSFERIIDAIGGVDIDVEKRMHYEDPWDDNGGLVIDLYPGEQHMDGKKAIQYVRYRDGEGDIGRIGRQQKFMKAVVAQVLSPEILPRLPDIVKEVSSAVKTDMSVTDFLSFAKQMKTFQANGLETQMVPGQPAYHKDISYWIPDITDVRELMASALELKLTAQAAEEAQAAEDKYDADLPKDLKMLAHKTNGSTKLTEQDAKEEDDKPMKPEEISVMVINSSGIDGAGAEVAAVLQRKGFIISGVETGKTNANPTTTITTSTRNTDVFYGMPFACVIRDGGSSNQAVVNIGRDYKKKGR